MPAGPPARILFAPNNSEKNSGVVLDYGSLAVFLLMGLKRFDRVTSIEMDSPAM
jgi:hypothetical protein